MGMIKVSEEITQDRRRFLRNAAMTIAAASYTNKFSGKFEHRIVNGGVGHNLPREAPEAFAKAIVDVDGY